MLHTAEYYLKLDDLDVDFLYLKYPGSSSGKVDAKAIDCSHIGFHTTVKKYYNNYLFKVVVNFVDLLNRADITPSDYELIQNKINQYLYDVFNINDKELILVRLDYRYDAVIPNSDKRKLLLHLYKKTASQIGFKVKNTRYKTSLYFNSKSINLLIYDKETERAAKGCSAKDYEKNVFRFEVSLRNKHLNYIKKSYNIPKQLKYYLNDAMFNVYMKKNFKNISFTSDYFNLYMTDKILEASTIKSKEKQLIRKFLVDVSVKGFDYVKQNNSKYVLNKILKELKELNINPILIPKHQSSVAKFIRNPLKNIFERVL